MFRLIGNICVLGDSIVYGAWDDAKHGYVNRLKEKYNQNQNTENIYGLGIPGETTEGLLKRIDSELNPREPSAIIIAVGLNDTIYIKSKNRENVSLEGFIDNISKIIDVAKKYTDNILVLGLTKVIESLTTPILWNDDEMYFNNTIKKYDKALEVFCNNNNIDYIKMFDLLEDEDFSDDGIHPNEKGHEKIYEIIKEKGEGIYE